MKTLVLIYLIALFTIQTVFCSENVEVKLNQGILLGKEEQTMFLNNIYYAFRSIPYAEPPVGKLRFQVISTTIFTVVNASLFAFNK